MKIAPIKGAGGDFWGRSGPTSPAAPAVLLPIQSASLLPNRFRCIHALLLERVGLLLLSDLCCHLGVLGCHPLVVLDVAQLLAQIILAGGDIAPARIGLALP